ncbi:MAG TPA: protein kinase [Candidatus Limnocylindrales bacterium]
MADIGRMIGGRYKLVELLGEGSYATVYRATDIQANHDVAVKMLRPEFSRDPDFMSDFRWQSRVAANVDHPNIARVLDFGTERSGAFLVSEYVDGADLATLLERNGPVPPRRAARAVAEAARALQAAHDRGLPHGDLQPSNVMVTRDGHVKVTDFGVARAAAAVNDATNANIKNHPDIGSSQAGRRPDPRTITAPSEASDVEALGFLLYEMLTGRAPWVGETLEEIVAARKAGPPPKPSTIKPAVPAVLDEVTMRALSPNVDLRYASAALVADALEAFVYGGEATAAESAADGAEESADMARPAVPYIPRPAVAAEPLIPAAAPRPSRNFYSDDAYASGPSNFKGFDSDDDTEDSYALEPGRARRQARKAGLDDDLDDEEGRTSPWAWVAGVLGILLIAIVGFIVFLLTVGAPKAAPSTILAPNLASYTLQQAQQDGQRLGFSVSPTYQANTGTQAENTIVSQNPLAGTTINVGDTIIVTIVTGPGTVIVPDVTGKTENDARTAITTAGLTPGNRSDQYDPVVPAGQVVTQDPHSGTLAQYGSTVNYVVSKGPEPTPSPTPSPSPSPSPTPIPTPLPTPVPTPTPPPTTPPPTPTAAPSVA